MKYQQCDNKKLQNTVEGNVYCPICKLVWNPKDEIDKINNELGREFDKLVASSPLKFVESLEQFLSRVSDMLTSQAIEKGYAEGKLTDANGRRLYDFIESYAGPGHALGEIIYKATRFKSKKDPEDLVKIAAWAFLIWDKGRRVSK